MRPSPFAVLRTQYLIPFILAVSVLLIASVTLADIAFGSFSSANSNDVTVTQVTVAKPSSVATGDLLLANIAINGGSQATTTAPSGWTQILRTDNDTAVSIPTHNKLQQRAGRYTLCDRCR
jgi:hypothetical protein